MFGYSWLYEKTIYSRYFLKYLEKQEKTLVFEKKKQILFCKLKNLGQVGTVLLYNRSL